jgi:hypothetical protein
MANRVRSADRSYSSLLSRGPRCFMRTVTLATYELGYLCCGTPHRCKKTAKILG